MGAVLIIGLVALVVGLGYTVYSQSQTIKNYEKELIKKARKSKNATK